MVSLGAIFDGAVFSKKRLQAQFFVKYCIQRDSEAILRCGVF